MQEYDVTLKLLLRGSAKLTMRELTGISVKSWLDVDCRRFKIFEWTCWERLPIQV